MNKTWQTFFAGLQNLVILSTIVVVIRKSIVASVHMYLVMEFFQQILSDLLLFE